MEEITLPPFPFKPEAYAGPSAEEVFAVRKEFLNPGIFLYYKKPLMLVRGRCNTCGTKPANVTSMASAAS